VFCVSFKRVENIRKKNLRLQIIVSFFIARREKKANDYNYHRFLPTDWVFGMERAIEAIECVCLCWFVMYTM
jgi:hypothetical protein